MEVIEIDNPLYEYFSKLTLPDLFPKSIAYPKIQDESTILIEETQSNPQQSNPPIINIDRHKNYSFIFDKSAPASCIKVLNNILVICGGIFIKVYDIESDFELIHTFKLKSTKSFNTLALTCLKDFNGEFNVVYCATAGSAPTIYILNVLEGEELKNNQLLGHRNEINDLKFHPFYNNILLSSSKDCTVRLWNILNCNQICIFGGPNSHLADVLSIDWHYSGEMFVSGGIDNSVKIYHINDKIKKLIEQSIEDKLKVKTLIKNFPYFSCNEVHDNYIDCVQFNGNFIISKSVDGVIKEWLPTFSKEGNYFFLINTYFYHVREKIFNVKYFYLKEKNLLFVSNEYGKAYGFSIDENSTNVKKDYHFFQSPALLEFEIKKDCLFRTCEYSSLYNILFFGGDNGEVHLFHLIDNSK